MTATNKIRILIADDFKFLRDVIRLYLNREPDLEVVDEAPDLEDALRSALSLQPDVIIMNDYLPPVDTAYAAALCRERGVRAAILTISMRPEARLIQRALEAGVNGLISKEEISEHLVNAIRSIQRGETFLSPRAQSANGHRPAGPADVPPIRPSHAGGPEGSG